MKKMIKMVMAVAVILCMMVPAFAQSASSDNMQILRDKVKAEWQALTIGLWRLALERSFPHDGDVIFATFMAQHTRDMRPKKAEAFTARVGEYVTGMLAQGDADFIPAAKLARYEGIDFILDPMWQGIAPDLHEHIDGLQSVCPRPF